MTSKEALFKINDLRVSEAGTLVKLQHIILDDLIKLELYQELFRELNLMLDVVELDGEQEEFLDTTIIDNKRAIELYKEIQEREGKL